MGDIYFARHDPSGNWGEPRRLACAPTGPNSALDEQGPSFAALGRRELLFFSRSSATVAGDIYVATRRAGGSFREAVPVVSLNDAAANDIQPNMRKDGREVVISSNRSAPSAAKMSGSRREPAWAIPGRRPSTWAPS